MNHELAATFESLHLDAYGWALHCCDGDHSRAEDVLQAAYLKVLQGRATHEGRSAFKTWWFGTIRLTAYEEFRRLRYRESLLGRMVSGFFPGADEADPRPSPVRQLEIDEQAGQLRAMLAQLPARQAEVLHLVFYQDLTVVEAAAIMSISAGSARQHYDRGKARLRALMETSSLASRHE